MRILHGGPAGALVALLAVLATAGCDEFLTADNPNIVDADQIDPLAEAGSLALSVEQEFAEIYSRLAAYGAWYTGSLYNSDINPGGNLLSSRNLEPTHGSVGNAFDGLARTRALASLVQETVEGTAQETSGPAARAALFYGHAFLSLGEFYCRGAVGGGPALTTDMMMDSAAHHFSRASAIAQQVGGAAAGLHDAALVGLARTYLHRGDDAQALAAAEAVSPGFVYDLRYSEDLANRDRVGNWLYYSQASQTTISVAPDYRNLGDPRVVTLGPENHNFVAMDGETPIWSMVKYGSYSSPIRLASRLEADYLAAEARGTDAMLALLQQRRTLNGQGAYTGPTDAAGVLEEFLEQKTRDFFVEGKRMGDFRDHPGALRTMKPAGATYHKAGLPAYADQGCWPLPDDEVANNPNLQP